MIKILILADNMSEELKNNENTINEVISTIYKFADNDTLKKYEEYP